MKRRVIIIITILVVLLCPFLYESNVGAFTQGNGHPVAIIPVDCITYDSKYMKVTCIVTFKDRIVLDTARLTGSVYRAGRKMKSDSLRSQSCLNEFGIICSNAVKDNDQVYFIRYYIEYDPDNTEPLKRIVRDKN